MSKVSVKYTGTKHKISIRLPIGVKIKAASIGTAEFIKGEPLEMKEADAAKLCANDSNFEIVSGVLKEVEKETVLINVLEKKKKLKVKKSLEMDEDEMLNRLLG